MKQSINNLLAQKQHILTSIDGHRQKLSGLWNKGIKQGALVDHHKALMERGEKNLDNVNDLIFDHPCTH